MPLFAPILKLNRHLEHLHFTVCIVGSRKITEQDNYDQQGWGIFAPQLTIYGFDADEDACIAANADLEERQINWTEKHYPLAIAQKVGSSTLYVTKHPMCSSLYPPNEPLLSRLAGLPELVSLDFTVELETTTLDAVSQAEALNTIDFLQIDVQGADLQVLEGATNILKQGVHAVQIEVEFAPLYQGQPLFADVDAYLRQRGFTLFDVLNSYRPRAIAPLTSSLHAGQLLWGEAFYLRDLINPDCEEQDVKPDSILKLACIADVLGFTDYCAELLAYLTVNFGENPLYNCADSIVMALAQIPNLFENKVQLPIVNQMTPYLSQPLAQLIERGRSVGQT